MIHLITYFSFLPPLDLSRFSRSSCLYGRSVVNGSYFNTGSTAGASSTGATSAPGSTAGASSTASQSHSSSPSLNQNKSHSGKIAGASAGVLVAVLLLIGVILWYLRRWRSRAKILPARFSDSAARIAGAFGLPDPNY